MRVSPREVTFRHLLTHTSGLAPWLKLFEEMGDIPPPQGIADLGERARRYRRAVEIVSTCPFAGPPDTGIRYSDQGMILLGEAVARLHGTSLDMAVVQRVLRSLKLESTVYNPLVAGFSPKQVVPTEFDARWRGRRAHGEVHDENAASLGGVAGHAGLFSTAREVGIFGDAWLHCVTSGDQGALLVSPDIAQEAVRIQEAENNLRYGLGWVLKPTGDYASAGRHMSLDTFGHTGFTSTSLFIDPERNLMVAALTNRVYHGRDPEPIAAFRPVLHDAIVEALPNGE
jgi:CubicO group peptidase (beta-lactamase class C family)